MRAFAPDHNACALALYGQLLQRSGNLFFSPFSVRVALAMPYIGARGETASQISKALRFESSGEGLHSDFAEIIEQLIALDGAKYEMVIANSLWGQVGMPLQVEFRELVDRYYRSGLNLVDFRRNAELARGEINRWVEGTTKYKIQDLIPPGVLTVDTRLVLVNAVYFKGRWVRPFSEEDTHDMPFYLEGGGQVRVPMMRQESEFRYFHTDGFQAVDLDYQGSELSMLVLLPDHKDGLRDLETRLSAERLQDCVGKMPVREVKLLLPRFKMTWGTIDLRNILSALGMQLAFSRFAAEFSGINGYVPPDEEALFISAVYHKAFVEVNEEGTEAAAATAVSVAMFSGPTDLRPSIPVFRADHPFLFAIRDRQTGGILFLGRVADPTRES